MLLVASGGDFGEWPDDFEEHDVGEIWHCPPMAVLEAPVHFYERALLRRSIINQGRADAARNANPSNE